MAKERKKPVILICEDLKEDWWWISPEGTMGPRPELIQEFSTKTEMLFYMYSLDQFMDYANKYINTKIDKKVILEAKEYRYDEVERLSEQLNLIIAEKQIEKTIRSAEILINLGKVNEAYLESFKALELHLVNLCEINHVQYDKRSAMNQLLANLTKAEKIEDLNLDKIKNLINIRNNLAHFQGQSTNLTESEIIASIEFIKNLVMRPLSVEYDR